jgi:hypothetical protein
MLLASVSKASLITIGNGSTNAADCTIGCMKLYQQGYDSSYFGSSEINLDSLTLYGSGNFGQYDVSVGYMNGNYSNITTNYASNFASLPSYASSIDLATDFVGNAITIALNFVYNPSLGDLLIQFERTSATSGGSMAGSSTYLWSRAYEWSSGSKSAHSGYALNSIFKVSDVPEPATLAILALGLFGLGARRFKK